MAVSMNLVISFNPPARYQLVMRTNKKTLSLKIPSITSPSGVVGSRKFLNGKVSTFHLLATEGDQVTTEANDNDSKTLEESYSYNGNNESSKNPVNSLATEDEAQPTDKRGLTAQISEDSNSSLGSKYLNQDTSESKSNSTMKRSPLTARERLRAARVLSRYTESKPSKPELGSKLLEALQETDKGKKRPGLPQAPTNLFDDSKRGLPKEGWTINIIPGGMDVFLIIFSFVFISSVMFATTYIVWKVGAIHFNEY